MGIETLLRQADKDGCRPLMEEAIQRVNQSFNETDRQKYPGTYIGAIECLYMMRRIEIQEYIDG